MAFRKERKTQAFGAPTPSQLRDQNEAVSASDARAARRYQLAKIAAEIDGSYRAKRRFIMRAMDVGHMEKGPVPSVETLRYLHKRWEAGEQSIEDYYDQRRSGRPRQVLPAAIERQIQTVLSSGQGVNALAMSKELAALARKKGLRAPTYRQVHRRFASAGRLTRAAARYGSRAGEMDGLPHARVVTRHSHDCWALDELTLPVWTRLYYVPTRQWVSTLVDVVLVIDVKSTAVVGYHIVDPTRRKDEEGRPHLAGFDSEDVLVALLSAACPELATDATQEFAGFLPDRLRWDNAQAHKKLRAEMKAAGIAIDVRPIRVRRAASNAAVERRVGILKKWCAGLHGHVDDYVPTDQVDSAAYADLPRQRTLAAGYSGDRETRLSPILPEQLMTLDEVREAFDEVVQRYNFEHVNRVQGMTAADSYQISRRDRRPRRGDDLVRLLKPRTVSVTTDGILFTDRGRTHQYYPLVEGRMILLDQAVTFYSDPCGRGIFIVQPENRLAFLPPQHTWSDEEAEQIARNQSFITRLISDGAAATRRDTIENLLGAEGAKAAEEEYATQSRRLREASGNAEQDEAVIQVIRPTRPSVDDYWADDDPEVVLQPLEDDLDETDQES